MTNLYNLIGDESEEHYLDAMEFFILANGQEITLPYAMYIDKLVITRTVGGAVIEASPSTFEFIIDYDSASVGRLLGGMMASNAITKKIRVLMANVTIAGGFGIKVKGYAFETPYNKIYGIGDTGPIPTPGLMQHILQELSFMANGQLNSQQNLSTLLQGNSPKEFDPTGTSNANRVLNEAHYISATKTIIMPSAGDFYAHDVAIQFVGGGGIAGRALTIGLDYELASLRITKIMASASPNPIYGSIVIKAAIVGTVLISYRAVGGQITNTHFTQMVAAFDTLSRNMQTSGILTEANIHRSSSFLGLQGRIRALEAMSGIYPKRQYTFTIPNSDLNWYTIGKIGYDSTGTPVVAGLYYLDVNIPSINTTYVLMMTIDLRSATTNNFDVVSITSIGSPAAGIVKTEDSLAALERSAPMLRIVYIGDPTTPETFKGGLLQIGYRGTSGDTFHPIITDKSEIVDGFDLVPVVPLASAQNDNIQIDDSDDAIWSSLVHHTSQHILAHTLGELLWQGCLPLTSIAINSFDLDLVWANEQLDLSSIHSVEMIIKDRHTGSLVVVRNEHAGDAEIAGGSLLFDPADTCILRYALFYDESDNLVLSVEADLGIKSIALDRFELQKIVVKF